MVLGYLPEKGTISALPYRKPLGGIHESPERADHWVMRCLYCGKELALLKRLTGGGDFCSEVHKQSYQEEYNRLALSRLLQAQKKKQQQSSENAAPPALETTVAVQERISNDSSNQTEEAPAVALVPAASGSHAEPVPPIEADQAKESPAKSEDSAQSVGAEPEPSQEAGFLIERPPIAAPPEPSTHVESWLEASGNPALSTLQFDTLQFDKKDECTLSSAGLLSLKMEPKGPSVPLDSSSNDVAPQAFASAPADPRPSSWANLASGANINQLPLTSAISIGIEAVSTAPDLDRSLVEAMAFESTAVFEEPDLLELFRTPIDFPAEDSDVEVLGSLSTIVAGSHVTTAGENGTPRTSLEALSRLHQELAEEEDKRIEEPVAGVTAPTASGGAAAVRSVVAEVIKPAEIRQMGEAEPAKSAVQEPKPGEPKYAHELLEIPIKTFAPPKPAAAGGDPLPSETAALLPQMKSLPLRPKMALATGYVPPANGSTSSPAKPATTDAKKPMSASPANKTSGAAKPAAGAIAKIAESRATASQKTPAAKIVVVKAETTAPASQAVTPQQTKMAEASPVHVTTAVTRKPAPAEAEKEEAKLAPRVVEETSKKNEDVPNFSVAQLGNVSWLSSLKLKLVIAILIVVIACAYFLGWGGGKSGKRAASSAAVSADGAGPSIILGEGGWVENWAGDPVGMRAGREITIYQPSLKLSDYRLAFQGSIDTKSIGWVFRALDPENYYAMKLMNVSSGLTPKVALFKYLVFHGRQTQVGRVPINLPIQPDMVFDIRVDVQGPRFTTYIQGQQVDSWTDDQLKVGGAGFLNEREERGKVNSVSIRYLNGGAK